MFRSIFRLIFSLSFIWRLSPQNLKKLSFPISSQFYQFSSNLPAPINVSSTEQTKAGNLIIGGVLTTAGFKMTTGAGADKVLTTDASGVASWTTAAAGATTAGSTGYIQFNNAGALGADSNLFWDSTNERLGIGTTTPAYALDINGALRLRPSGVPSEAKGTIYYDVSTDTFKGYRENSWVNFYEGSQTGYMISTVLGATAATIAKSAAADILISPIFIPFSINVNAFLLQVTTALGATGDVGLYNSNGSLVLNGGSGTLTTATGLKSVAPVQTGSNRVIPPGFYYVAVTWNSTTGIIAGVNVSVSGLIPRTGTITGGGSVLPSSITLSNITTTNYIYAVTLSGDIRKENGAICSSESDCLSGICYISNDGDLAYGTSGTPLCRSTATIGLDCDDSCATCYPGSTEYTTSPDGKDQDCNGTVDEESAPDCTATYGTSVVYGYDASCVWKAAGGYQIETSGGATWPTATQCTVSGTSCTSYTSGWGNCLRSGVLRRWQSGISAGITCNGRTWGQVTSSEQYYSLINCSPMTACTKTAHYH